MAGTLVAALFSGLPVGIVLAGVSMAFGMIGAWAGILHAGDLNLVFYRVYGTLSDSDNIQYAAVPALIFMGALLANGGMASGMLAGLREIMPRFRGRIAVISTLLAVALAPTAGVIAASVSALALMAFPAMMKEEHTHAFAAGTIAAAGTLAVSIPPNVFLFFIANGLGIQIAALFLAMIGPILLLLAGYVTYQILAGRRDVVVSRLAETDRPAGTERNASLVAEAAPGLFVILSVVASVIYGVATLSESAAVGATAALAIGIVQRRLPLRVIVQSVVQTIWTTGMVFFIFIGATAFSVMFRLSGGADGLFQLVAQMNSGPVVVLGAIMLIVFVLGFFVDWVEIVLITFPVFRPIMDGLDFSPHTGAPYLTSLWIASLLALNLQMSFLTPPFGFSLFLTRASTPPEVSLTAIYRGVVPYVCIYLAVMGLVAAFPAIVTALPAHFLDLTVTKGPSFAE